MPQTTSRLKPISACPDMSQSSVIASGLIAFGASIVFSQFALADTTVCEQKLGGEWQVRLKAASTQVATVKFSIDDLSGCQDIFEAQAEFNSIVEEIITHCSPEVLVLLVETIMEASGAIAPTFQGCRLLTAISGKVQRQPSVSKSKGGSQVEPAYSLSRMNKHSAALKFSGPPTLLWLEVTLNGHPTEAELKALAMDLWRQNDGSRYDRCLIGYRLEGQLEGYYATTEWTPHFQLKFNGFPYDDAVEAVDDLLKSLPANADLLGLWNANFIFESFEMLYRHESQVVLEARQNGMNRGGQVVEERGEWFWVPGTSDRYQIRGDGTLEVRDNDGVVYLGRSVLN